MAFIFPKLIISWGEMIVMSRVLRYFYSRLPYRISFLSMWMSIQTLCDVSLTWGNKLSLEQLLVYQRVTFIVTKTQQERTKSSNLFVGFSHMKQQRFFVFCSFSFPLTDLCFVLHRLVGLYLQYTDFVVVYHSSSQFTNNTYPTQQASLSNWRNSI